VLRLIGQRWSEHLTDTPAQAGSLHASEWLIASDLSAFDEVVAASDRGPAIVLTPMGAGRVMVVGAMDAWRRRGGGDEAYARFWRVAVARLAEAAGPAVAVSVEPTWARPGQDVSVRVSARSTAVVTTWLATATLACDDSAGLPLRLWPANAAGEFEARARLDGSTASCTVTARVEGLGEGTAHILVTPRAPEPASSPELLDRAIARTGGLALRESDVPRLVDASRAGGSTDRVPDTRYPMRSSWWMLPLVTCLAGEWWLRRRNGLR
jgi:hypothetical protein